MLPTGHVFRKIQNIFMANLSLVFPLSSECKTKLSEFYLKVDNRQSPWQHTRKTGKTGIPDSEVIVP